jgi:hypothetical protein
MFGGFVKSIAFTNALDSTGTPGAFGDMATAVNQSFLNGGTQTYVVGLINDQVQALPPATVNANGIRVHRA